MILVPFPALVLAVFCELLREKKLSTAGKLNVAAPLRISESRQSVSLCAESTAVVADLGVQFKNQML